MLGSVQQREARSALASHAKQPSPDIAAEQQRAANLACGANPLAPEFSPLVAKLIKSFGHLRFNRPKFLTTSDRPTPDPNRPAPRSGQALIEFAFLIPLLVILIGATLSFGLFFFQANSLQQAVDVAAQEISRMPFPPSAQLGLGDLNAADTAVMFDTNFQSQIYDEQFLVIHDDEWGVGTAFNGDFQAYLDTLPLLNRLLANVMVRDNSIPTGVTRFPGAIVTNSITGEETVLVPLVTYDQVDATETIVQWVAPVEEIRPGGGQGPFSLTATNTAASFVPGMVALRINYPASSATLVNRTGERGENITRADDSLISNENTGSNYSLAVGAESGPADTTIHSGRYGLGRQAALFESNGIRPYRTVISVQAIYRREVFQ